jgi:hypothetical protein
VSNVCLSSQFVALTRKKLLETKFIDDQGDVGAVCSFIDDKPRRRHPIHRDFQECIRECYVLRKGGKTSVQLLEAAAAAGLESSFSFSTSVAALHLLLALALFETAPRGARRPAEEEIDVVVETMVRHTPQQGGRLMKLRCCRIVVVFVLCVALLACVSSRLLAVAASKRASQPKDSNFEKSCDLF